MTFYKLLLVMHENPKTIHFAVIQLVASADCAGALDVTDDLQHLLVYLCDYVNSFEEYFFYCLFS